MSTIPAMRKSPMAGGNELGEALIELLVAEIGLSERLLAHIGREQAQMEQPLHAQAEEQLQYKLELLQQLQATSERRMTLMQRQGFEATPQGVAACCAACGSLPELALAFRRLANLARECHEANQRLGLLLNRKSGFFARLLGTLTDGGQPPLYRANGHADPGSVNLRHRLSV